MIVIRSVVAALARKWWIVVGAAAIGALIVLTVGRLDGDKSTPTSSIRVGLSTAAEWPDYQPIIDSFGNIAAQQDVQSVVEETIGGQIKSVTVEPQEGRFVVDVQVEAATEGLAIDAAQELARTGISLQAERERGGDNQELATLVAEIEQVSLATDELAVEHDRARQRTIELGIELDQEFLRETDAVLREVQTEAELLRNALIDSEDRLRVLQDRQSDIELGLAPGPERLYIVRDAEIVSSEPAVSQTTQIVAGALAAALAAAAFVVFSDRLRGPVRSAAQIERVLGRPVVAHMVGSVDTYQGAGLRRALKAVGRSSTIEVIVEEGLQADGAALSADLNAICAADGADSGPVFVHESSHRADGVLIVAETGLSSMQSLTRDIRDHELAETTIVGVLLT